MPNVSSRSAYFTAGVALFLTVCVVLYPEASYKASIRGLKLWFDIVLPALFPFFTLAEILMGLGIVHAFGVLLEPVMRPIFRIPGRGALAVAIGLASGYPLGAKMTGDLRRAGLCSREEAERIVSFANTADPLFLSGAAAVGMFHDAKLGGILVAAHYLAVFGVGLCMRFHARGEMAPAGAAARRGSLLGESLRTLVDQRSRDARPLGQVFGDAVRSSLQSLLFVGGCIIMFSVFIAVLQLSGVLDLMSIGLGLLLQPVGVDPAVIPGLVNGAIEITLGTQSVAAAHASLVARLAAAGAIIAWSGISVHAQVAAMLHGTDVRLRPYILARALHAALAAIVTFVLMGLFGAGQPAVTASVAAAAGVAPAVTGLQALWHSTLAATALFGGSGVLLAGMAAMRGVRVRLFRV